MSRLPPGGILFLFLKCSTGYSYESKKVFIFALTLPDSSGQPYRFSLFPVMKHLLCSVVKLPIRGRPPPGSDTGGLGYWSLDAGKTVLLYGWLGLIQSLLPGELWLHTHIVLVWLWVCWFPLKRCWIFLSGLPLPRWLLFCFLWLDCAFSRQGAAR